MSGIPIFILARLSKPSPVISILCAISDPKTILKEYRPCKQHPAQTIPASENTNPGATNRPTSTSIFLTISTAILRGRRTTISERHCGQRSFPCRRRRRELEFSMSASQSRRQDSWAVSAQGQGERHSGFGVGSSVSSL